MKKSIISALLSAVCAVSFAQTTQTNYFLENNLYSYRTNPAVAGEKSFFGIFIPNFNLDASSNLGLSSVLYPNADGTGLVTGFNQSVSAETFLKKITDVTKTSANTGYTLLSLGVWDNKGKGFFSFEANIRENACVNIPKELFTVLKTGSQATNLDLSNLHILGQAYLEAAFGYSRKISEKIEFGARLKFLVGAINANASFGNANVTINGTETSFSADAALEIAAPYLTFGTKQSELDPSKTQVLNFNSINFNKSMIRPSGYGGSVDLGIRIKPIKGLYIDASVLDLGAIGWKYSTVGRSSASYSFAPVYNLDGGTVKEDWKTLQNKLKGLAEFQKTDETYTRGEMIPTTLNVGVKYALPAYDRLRFDALCSYRFHKYSSCYDLRAGASVTPIDWFSVCANAGYTTYGPTFGGGLSITFASLNLFAAFDGYIGSITDVMINNKKWPVPVNTFRYNLSVGLTISFDKRHNDFTPLKKKAKKDKSSES